MSGPIWPLVHVSSRIVDHITCCSCRRRSASCPPFVAELLCCLMRLMPHVAAVRARPTNSHACAESLQPSQIIYQCIAAGCPATGMCMHGRQLQLRDQAPPVRHIISGI